MTLNDDEDYGLAMEDGFSWLDGWVDEEERWAWECPTSDDAFIDLYYDFYEDRDTLKSNGGGPITNWPRGS